MILGVELWSVVSDSRVGYDCSEVRVECCPCHASVGEQGRVILDAHEREVSRVFFATALLDSSLGGVSVKVCGNSCKRVARYYFCFVRFRG